MSQQHPRAEGTPIPDGSWSSNDGTHLAQPADLVPTDEADVVHEDGSVGATYCATLVDEWVRLGLRDAVVSPGSRSTPMALALAEHGGVRVVVHHDERSAAFTALGIGLATGRPAALLCTSGTAAAEFHAAVVEAHQAYVPMIVITADRPSELHGVGAPQTIEQRDLYGTAVRWYCEPGAPAAGGAPWWRDLARDAFVRTLGERPGPVHLNLAFREPLLGEVGELPPLREPFPVPGEGERFPTGAQWGLPDEELARLVPALSGRRGVIVAGVRAARSAADARAVHLLADHLGWPVLADGPSGCRLEVVGCITAFDELLRHEPFAEEHRPEVVLRIGGLLTSKALNRWIAGSGALMLGLDPFGAVPDPDRVVTQQIPADVETVCDQLRSVVAEGAHSSWRDGWVAAERLAVDVVDGVLARHVEATEPAVAADLFELLSDDGIVVLSSSMPVRDAESYAPPRSGVRVLANRGANGIDGVVSTAVGASLCGEPTALLIGDVAFLHDSNGLLGLMARGVNLVIVVVDNDGGGIFSFLPTRDGVAPDRFEQLFGTPHGVDLCALAGAHGVPAERVSTRTGVQAAIAGALTRGGPRVVVVETDREANRRLHEELHRMVAAALDRR
jgi:2-succinyl-5-enolpyruvyl-6-hydroxy-3-cyclohexene-1-carboxylate synthase